MKIGIVGYQGSGKSTLFQWLTGEPADPAKAHQVQMAMATVPEPHVKSLCDIYQPKKVTLAALEILDTPGLSRTHEGSAQKLAMIREASCLIVVVAAFGDNDPAADLAGFEDDLLLTDLEIVSGRIERLREQVKKPRPNRDELQAELETLQPIQGTLESGSPLHQLELTPEQKKMIRSFQLFSEKPRLIVFNTSDDDEHPAALGETVPEGTASVSLSLALQTELSQLGDAERAEFCGEMGVEVFDRDSFIRTVMEVSQQMLFFTAGEKEVRTWMIRKGGTALDAADGIHTDLARGFIRAETMNVDDLIRLGSEREMKAQKLVRHEPKDYVIQLGDILLIRHN